MGRTMSRIAAAISLVVPGGGQALRGRLGDAALFLWSAAWLHTLVLGMLVERVGADASALPTWLLGALGAPGGLGVPEAVVFTAATLALHATSAWDALRDGDGQKSDGRGRQPPTSPV